MGGMRRLFQCLAVVGALLAALVVGTGAASADSTSAGGELLRVDMRLDCVNMTEQARSYAVEHDLCTADGQVGTAGVVTGNCGSSWIWIYNANGGRARFVYGYASTQGTVIAHVLRVSWYNWATGGASGWTDAAGRLSSSYETSRTTFTGAGYVTTGLSGFVTLWWGGTCNLLNPTDWVTVRP